YRFQFKLTSFFSQPPPALSHHHPSPTRRSSDLSPASISASSSSLLMPKRFIAWSRSVLAPSSVAIRTIASAASLNDSRSGRTVSSPSLEMGLPVAPAPDGPMSSFMMPPSRVLGAGPLLCPVPGRGRRRHQAEPSTVG